MLSNLDILVNISATYPVGNLRSWAKKIAFLFLRVKSCWITNKCMLEKIYFLAETFSFFFFFFFSFGPKVASGVPAVSLITRKTTLCRVFGLYIKASMLHTLLLHEYLQVVAV